MAQEMMLQAEPRTDTGKGVGRKLRQRGRIPAVVYGLGKANIPVSVDARTLSHLIVAAGRNAMIALQIDGGEVDHVLLRETQRDPVSERLVHADFFRIDPNRPVDVEVPVVAAGTPIGVREGGMLEQLLRTIEVRCVPSNMPTKLDVDVANLAMNHSIHVGEIPAPEGVEFLTPAESAVFTVLPPRVVEEAVEAAAGEAEPAEPEVIGRKKEEGEE